MAENKELIFDGELTPNALNFSSFFSGASFIYLKSSDAPDWSQTGDFTEIDVDLLVTVEPNVKRRVPLELNYASTRELIRIPSEFSDPKCLVELVFQASFAANLEVWAVSVPVPENDVDLVEEFERLRALVNLVLFLVGGPSLPSLPGIPSPDALPNVDWFPALPGSNP